MPPPRRGHPRGGKGAPPRFSRCRPPRSAPGVWGAGKGRRAFPKASRSPPPSPSASGETPPRSGSRVPRGAPSPLLRGSGRRPGFRRVPREDRPPASDPESRRAAGSPPGNRLPRRSAGAERRRSRRPRPLPLLDLLSLRDPAPLRLPVLQEIPVIPPEKPRGVVDDGPVLFPGDEAGACPGALPHLVVEARPRAGGDLFPVTGAQGETPVEDPERFPDAAGGGGRAEAHRHVPCPPPDAL